MGINIFFLTYVYPPLNYPRSIQISHLAGFLEYHFDIKVITSETRGRIDTSLSNTTELENVFKVPNSKLTEFIEDTNSYRIRQYFLHDLFCLWPRNLCSFILKKFNAPKVIISFGQPMSTHLSGLWLKRKFPDLVWLAHFSDPWIDNPYNDDSSWIRTLNKGRQDRVFKLADLLIFTSPETIKLVTTRFEECIHEKSVYLPHSFNPKLYSGNSKKSAFFFIRYFGTFYGSRQPDCLLKALALLEKLNSEISKDIKVEFIGVDKTISQKIHDAQLQHIVSVKPPLDYIKSLELMSETDLLLIIDSPSEFNVFFPSKLADYIGANRPIFGITPPGTSQKIVEELGFLTANPNDIEQVAQRLIEMIKRVKSGAAMMNQQVRRHYSVEVVGNQLAEMLNKVINRRSFRSEDSR
jgi:glycosyltransferase involved in cell wall biosynthesis